MREFYPIVAEFSSNSAILSLSTQAICSLHFQIHFGIFWAYEDGDLKFTFPTHLFNETRGVLRCLEFHFTFYIKDPRAELRASRL